jgi:hypothetical protein
MVMFRDPSYGIGEVSLPSFGNRPQYIPKRDPALPPWLYTPYPPALRPSPSQPSMVLIRGILGAGKSEVARTFALTHRHLEADDYFLTIDGWFFYRGREIVCAHEWCENMTRASLEMQESVVVSNTFCTNDELLTYLWIAEAFEAPVTLIDLLPSTDFSDVRLPRGAERQSQRRQFYRWEWCGLDACTFTVPFSSLELEPFEDTPRVPDLPYLCQPGTCEIGEIPKSADKGIPSRYPHQGGD